jgi:hypothetical protein
MNILYIEFFCPQKTHNRTLLLGSIHLKHGRPLDDWNQPMNMHMHVCCLDSHKAGLCCYLVIHIKNLLRSLQLFYFHLCSIYWISLVYFPNIALRSLRETNGDILPGFQVTRPRLISSMSQNKSTPLPALSFGDSKTSLKRLGDCAPYCRKQISQRIFCSLLNFRPFSL